MEDDDVYYDDPTNPPTDDCLMPSVVYTIDGIRSEWQASNVARELFEIFDDDAGGSTYFPKEQTEGDICELCWLMGNMVMGIKNEYHKTYHENIERAYKSWLFHRRHGTLLIFTTTLITQF
jgi:hypothetical protein